VPPSVDWFSLLSLADSHHCPCEVIVNWGCLARRPVSGHDREYPIGWSVDKIVGESVFPWIEGLFGHRTGSRDQSLHQWFQTTKRISLCWVCSEYTLSLPCEDVYRKRLQTRSHYLSLKYKDNREESSHVKNCNTFTVRNFRWFSASRQWLFGHSRTERLS